MEDIADRIRIAEEIHKSKVLKDFIQRNLEASTRVQQIKDYLNNQPQRFFNALVIGIYGGNPQWYELGIVSNERLDVDEIPLSIQGALGFLILEGEEKLFALDGQHRVVGIRESVKDLPNEDPLRNEEVAAVFVAHSNTEEGMERTRRLFTTLNRHAKPVSKKDIIALDEDDLVAIITRKLVEEHPLFKEKVSTDKSKSIQPSDDESFTSIIALYDGLDIYLRGSRQPKTWNDIKRFRPNDEELEIWYKKSEELWDYLIENFESLAEMSKSNRDDKVARKYRNQEGGELWFRPIGFLLYLRLISLLTRGGISLPDSIHRVMLLPRLLTNEPWVGLLWDNINNRMLTSPQNQKIAFQLAANALNIALPAFNLDKLKQEMAGIMRKDVNSVVLPNYVE